MNGEPAARAYQAGLRRIEVTSFVSPPADEADDAERVVAGLKERDLAGAEWLGDSLEHEVPGMLSRAGAFPP